LTICDFELIARIPLPDGIEAHPRTLGEHIRKVRFERKLNLIETARLLNVTNTTLKKWESNEVRVTPMYFDRINKFLEN
jgi:transcriptional regulator with XRE-family HTH domain